MYHYLEARKSSIKYNGVLIESGYGQMEEDIAQLYLLKMTMFFR
jgi:hypothetical protein